MNKIPKHRIVLAVIWLCIAIPASYLLHVEFAYRDWMPTMGRIVAVRSEPAPVAKGCPTTTFVTIEYVTATGMRIQEEEPQRCYASSMRNTLKDYKEFTPILYNPAQPTEFVHQPTGKYADTLIVLVIAGVAVLLIAVPVRRSKKL